MLLKVFLRILCIFPLIGGIVVAGISRVADKNQLPDTSNLHSTSTIQPDFPPSSTSSPIEPTTNEIEAAASAEGYPQQPHDTSPSAPSIPKTQLDGPSPADTHNELINELDDERTLEAVVEHWAPKRIGALHSETSTDDLILVNACVEESGQSPHTTTMQTLEADGSYDVTTRRYVRAQHVVEPQADGLAVVATLVGDQLFTEISVCISSWP